MWAFTPLRTVVLRVCCMSAGTQYRVCFFTYEGRWTHRPPPPAAVPASGAASACGAKGACSSPPLPLLPFFPLELVSCFSSFSRLLLPAPRAITDYARSHTMVWFSSVAHIHRIVPLDSGVLALLISPLLLVLLLLALPLPDLLLLPRSTICIGRPDCRPFAYATPSSTSDRNSNHLQTRTVYQS